MEQKYYVFECGGPYGWQIAEVTKGPYYDETTLISKEGYDTEQEAIAAINRCVDQYIYGPFFVMKGYHP